MMVFWNWAPLIGSKRSFNDTNHFSVSYHGHATPFNEEEKNEKKDKKDDQKIDDLFV